MSSIRKRMAVAMGAASIALLIIGGGGIFLTLKETLTDQFDEALITKAQALVSASEIDDDEFELDFDIQSFAGFGSRTPGDYFEIRTPEGRFLAGSPSLGTAHLPVLRSTGSGSDGTPVFATVTLPNGRPGRAVSLLFAPRDDDDQEYNNLDLVVASDTSGLNRTLGAIATVVAVFGGLGVVAALAIVHFILGAGLRPLARLAREVQRIDLATRRTRISSERLPTELTPVADKLNELLGRLEETFARERRFSSHAAHELRTPLAELKVMTELGARWPQEFTTTHGQEMLVVIAELEALLDKLSILARADSDAAVQQETLPLRSTIEECLQPFEARIAERGLAVKQEIQDGAVFTDRILWKTIVTNLLANAVHHAPAASPVSIFATPKLLRVRNRAPNLTANDLDQIFERFWQKNPSSGTQKRSGLGLSIVKACAETLGGDCTARLENGSITLEVTWR